MRPQQRVRLNRVLVASDGEPQADAALHLAKLIAEHHDAQVEVVGVFSPRIPVPPLGNGSAEHGCEHRDRRAVAALLGRIWQQARVRVKVSWPISLRVGHPPWMIADLARSSRADLVVMGRVTDGNSETRRATRHTAEQLACAADVPLLVVPPDLRRLPRTAVAVVDRSPSSRRAIRLTRSLVEPRGKLHVVPGPATRELLPLAEAVGAELLSVHLPGDSFAVRTLMGGGVAEILDHARCAVLVTPSIGAKRSEAARPRSARSGRSPALPVSAAAA